MPEHGAAAGRADAPATAGRVIAALVIGQLGLHAAMAGLRLAAPLQALREGHGAWDVGLLLALFAAAPVLTAMPAGRWADRWGYHRPVHGAVGLALAGGALAVASTFVGGALHFLLLCGGAMATGAGANIGMLSIQRTAGVAARDNTERVRVFSWLGLAPPLSNVIGPVACGLMIDAFGFRAACLLLLALPLATLVSARFVPRGACPAPAAAGARASSWGLLRAPGMKRLLLVNWLVSMCWDVHTFAVPILGHERGFAAGTIGLILGSFTLTITLIRGLIPLVAHRINDTVVLRAAMLATAAVFALYPLAPTALAMGGLAVALGVAMGAVQPMVMTMLHQVTPDQRHGEALAFRSMALNTSSTVMPLIFGATGTLIGAGVLFWVVGGAVGAGSWAARRLGSGAQSA